MRRIAKPTRLTQLDFWKGFSAHLDESNSSFNSRKAAPQNWYALSMGTTRAHISCTVLVSKSGRLGCEVYIPGRARADVIFEALHAQKAEIEQEVGDLDWQELPDRKACRVIAYRDDVDFTDRERWPELFAWLLERAEALKAAFANRVKEIEIPEADDQTVASAASSTPASFDTPA